MNNLENEEVSYITLYRKMSFEEFEKFIHGENLIAYNEPYISTSAIEPVFYFSDNLEDLYYLTQIDHEYDILCEFEVKADLLEKGYGKIVKSLNYGSTEQEFNTLEFYLSQYNNQLIKLTNCFSFHDLEALKQSREIDSDIIDYIHKFDYVSLQDNYWETVDYLNRELEIEADEELCYDADEEQALLEEYYSELELELDSDIGYDASEIAEGIEPRKGEIEEILFETKQITRQNKEQEHDGRTYDV